MQKQIETVRDRSLRPSVHIVLTDRGWIIEELSRHLADRLPYVTVGTTADPSAAIQYYMTYSARSERNSPIEVALFTHREEDPNAALRFDQTAQAVDHAISMSHATDRLIEQLGVVSRSCISPGVDFERFRPRLSIGVVGRTYHTGRKGEALVRAVMDVPDIDWHFTGSGWPEPGLHVPDDALPAFYRAMDYILVPATNEGGPMCVLEALASGTPVIASDVGWAAEFPNIPFVRGDAASLRVVIEGLRAERFAMRDSVGGMTWNAWVDAHDALFATLGRQIVPGADSVVAEARRVRSVALVTHGAEDTTLGGPSVRVPRTRTELERLHLRVTASTKVARSLAEADIVHGFNIWAPLDAYRMARQVQRLGRPLVFSPILLDLSEGPFWQAEVLRIFRASASAEEVEAHLDHAAIMLTHDKPQFDFEPGYKAALQAIDGIANAMIFLSDYERRLFERVTGAPPSRGFLVRNPVDADQFDDVSPDLFRETFSLDDYVLCVGRIEHRKNQLILANALASTDLPLVLIGHEADEEYGRLVRRFGGPNLRMMGRIEPGSDLLRSAIKGARVFTLPSWAEGAPLAALEASAAGVKLVLSDRSSEQEYFGEHARYCDPASSRSIRENILAAWNEPEDATQREALRKLVRDRYHWVRHAEATRQVYEAVAASPARSTAATEYPDPVVAQLTGIVLDITTWANNAATLSGIIRVECEIARALLGRNDVNTRFIVYLDISRFVEVPRRIIESDTLKSYIFLLRSGHTPGIEIDNLANCSDFVTVGSSWMQNASYAMSVAAFARAHDLRMNVLMHDLTPYLFPQWYPDGYATPWTANCRFMIANADRLLHYSASTARDVERFCFDQEVDIPAMATIRLADEIGHFAGADVDVTGGEVATFFARRPFVLAVGGLHVRKNYGLLYDVWTMLAETMGEARPYLVIVGGLAWNGQDTARAISEDPRVNKHIRILSGVDDDTLDWLYDNSLFTVYPSLYEGWGLPVGESLARGKICLSSNVSSMPEIAPTLTDLLPPLDRAAWAARIEHYARSPTARQHRETEIRQAYQVTTWAATAAYLLQALGSPTCEVASSTYVTGATALCNTGSGLRYLDSGWYGAERWGVWSGQKVATLRLRLPFPATRDLILTVLAGVFKASQDARVYRVAVNGVLCGTIGFLAEQSSRAISSSVSRIRVPLSALGEAVELTISFEADALTRVNTVDLKSTDERELGIGLSAFMLEDEQLSSDAPRLFSTRPDVRAMLAVPVDRDLTRLLTDHPARPAMLPGERCHDLSKFVRLGSHSDGRVASAHDMIVLAIGICRFRPALPIFIDFSIYHPGASPKSIEIELLANDEPISALKIHGDGRFTARVSPEIVGRSDPLRLAISSLVGSTQQTAAFELVDLRLYQKQMSAVVSLPSGRTVNLSDHVLGYPPAEGYSGSIKIVLFCPDIRQDSVLIVDSGSDYSASLSATGETVAGLPHGVERSVHEIGSRTNDLLLTLTPVGGRAALDPIDKACRTTPCVEHFHLTALDHVDAGLSPRYLPIHGWQSVEEDGTRWGAASTVAFWVRPGASKGLAIHISFLSPFEELGDLCLSVDGIAIASEVIPLEEMRGAIVRVPLLTSLSTLRKIEITGLPVNCPSTLGINIDDRELSIKIIDLVPVLDPEI